VKRISILLVALLALVVSACASEEAASASPSEAAATVQPTPEPEPSEDATASEPASSGLAVPSIDLDGDPELADRFPDEVGGQPLVMQSMRGDQMEALGGSDPTFEEFLDELDAELSDVSVAFGGVFDPADPEGGLSVGAFRVLGASEDDLEREFLAASEDTGEFSGLEAGSVGGKDVLTGADPTGETDVRVFLYTKDDTLYFLTGSEEQAAEVLEALP
jgi:hypothetical protein